LCLFSGLWWLICSWFFVSFVYLFFFPYFLCWGGLGCIFGCDLISYVLMVSARESIFRLGYFSGIFHFVVIVLTFMLYYTFRKIGLLSFYFIIFFLRVDWFLLCSWFWVGVTNLTGFRLEFIDYFILYWLLFHSWGYLRSYQYNWKVSPGSPTGSDHNSTQIFPLSASIYFPPAPSGLYRPAQIACLYLSLLCRLSTTIPANRVARLEGNIVSSRNGWRRLDSVTSV